MVDNTTQLMNKQFGIGLNSQDIYNIYTTYFKSTKTNNNKLTGQFGLGSKSPFSLVQEFYVVSTYNNVQSVYKMYFDQTGTPNISLINENITSYCNGITVKFDVKLDQIHLYKEKTIKVCNWFKTTPSVYENNVLLPIENKTIHFKDRDWFIDTNNTQQLVVMGNVSYSIRASNIKNLNEFGKQLLNLPIVINFNIGDLEVLASREELGYNDATCINLINKINSIIDSIDTDTRDSIFSAKTLYQAIFIYNSIFGDTAKYGLTFLRMLYGKIYYWNNIKINREYIKADLENFYKNSSYGIRYIDYNSKNTVQLIKQYNCHNHIQYYTSTNLIVFDDTKTGGIARIKQWITTNKKENYKITIYGCPFNRDWQVLHNALGNPPVIWNSKLPVIQKPKNTVKKEKQVTLALYYNRYLNYPPKSTNNLQLNRTTGGYYIKHSNYCFVNKDGVKFNMNELLLLAIRAGLIEQNTPIYVAKGTNYNKIQKLPIWIDFYEYIKTKTIELVENENAKADDLATATYFESVKYKIGNGKLNSFHWEFRNEYSTMKECLTMYNTFQHNYYKLASNNALQNVISLAKVFKIPLKKGVVNPNVDLIVKTIKTTYSLLNLIDSNDWNKNFQQINHYVNLVDTAWTYFELSTPIIDEDDKEK
jgi:hypothetical protein